MIKLFAAALAAFSIFTVAAQTSFADNTSGARWYPFYGYRQPAYLTQRTAVTVHPAAGAAQPNGAQVYTANVAVYFVKLGLHDLLRLIIRRA